MTNFAPLAIPKLFPYQILGAQFLASHRQALLADRPRLGKTVQAIHGCDLSQQERSIDPTYNSHQSRILVICRAVAKSQWRDEFVRWQRLPRRVEICSGSRFVGDNTYKNPPPNSVSVVGYETVQNLLDVVQGKFDIVIADESHYLKNPIAVRTQKILGKKGVIHRTNFFWALTGTPTPNHHGELWTTLFTFGLTTLTYDQFVDRYCEFFDSDYGRQIKGSKTDQPTVDELRQILSPSMLRRTEAEVKIELPALFESTHTVEPGPVDFKALFPDEIEKWGLEGLKQVLKAELGYMAELEAKSARTDLLEMLKAKSKSISTLRKYTALQKVKGLTELIRSELDDFAYNKVVIFGIHTQALKQIAEIFHAYGVALLIGETTHKAAALLKQFQDPNSKIRIFIGNIQAAGTSISLSAANHIYFLEEDWTPGNNHQAMMRCGGIHQTQSIFVTKICLKDSVDFKVASAVHRKTEEQKKLYNNIADIL